MTMLLTPTTKAINLYDKQQKQANECATYMQNNQVYKNCAQDHTPVQSQEDMEDIIKCMHEKTDNVTGCKDLTTSQRKTLIYWLAN